MIAEGKPVEKEHEPVPLDREMIAWIELDSRLAGARNENGFVAPRELDYVLEREYGSADNPDASRIAGGVLAMMAIGRNEGAFEGLDDE